MKNKRAALPEIFFFCLQLEKNSAAVRRKPPIYIYPTNISILLYLWGVWGVVPSKLYMGGRREGSADPYLKLLMSFFYFFFKKISPNIPYTGDSVGSAALAKRLASLWKQQFPNIPIYIWGTGEGRRVALKAG